MSARSATHRVAAALGGALALAACSLVVDTSDLTTGGPLVDDAAAILGDASRDQNVTDAEGGAPSAESGVDAGFCESHTGPTTLFCEDFDHAPDLAKHYDFGMPTAGASYKLDSVALSAPGSLFCSYPADPSTQYSASGHADFPYIDAPITIHYELDLRTKETPSQAEIGGIGRGDYFVLLSISDHLGLVEGVPDGSGGQTFPTYHGTISPRVDGGWNRVDLYLRLPASGSPSIGVRVDGQDSIPERDVDSRALGSFAKRSSFLFFGLVTGHPSSGWSGRFDNLLVRSE